MDKMTSLWRHNFRKNYFWDLKMVSLCSSLIFLYDRVWFSPISYGLQEVIRRNLWYIRKKWLKWPKMTSLWRHNSMKFFFEKFSITFSESSQNFQSDTVSHLLSYLVFRAQNSKKCLFRRFYHISLIKSLLSG